MLRPVLLLICAAALAALPSAQGGADTDAQDRFGTYSVQPFIELQPGFTTEPRPVLTLELSGIGREPIHLQSVSIDGRRLPAQAWRVRLSRLDITPDRDLRIGLSRVSVAYTHPQARIDSGVQQVEHTFFVNRQQRARQIKFGSKGELLIDGKAIFVRGGYRSGQVDGFTAALPSARAAGFNLVHDYRFEQFDTSKLDAASFVTQAREYLGRARELGLGVFLGLPRTAARTYDEPALATIIAELSNEPALWMWYIYDEPAETTLTVSAAARVYDLLRRLDPTRPAIVVTNRVERMMEYQPFCDVLWYDRYPIVASAPNLVSLAPISAALQKARQTVQQGKPVWPVLQLQDNAPMLAQKSGGVGARKVTDATHRPNEAQLRAEAHLAIAQNAMAVIYFWSPQSMYSMETDTPGVWRSLSKVLHEVESLEAPLLSAAPAPALEIEGGHDKVLMWTRFYQDRVYVGVVNSAIQTPATLLLHAPSKIASFDSLSGDGRVELVDGAARIRLSGAGVAVFSFPYT